MRELPAGHDAVLLDFAEAPVPWRAAVDAAEAIRTAARSGELSSILDVVPTAETVLVQGDPGTGLDRLGIRRVLRAARAAPGIPTGSSDTADREPVVVDVTYDGEDLTEIAEATGLSVDTVITTHGDTLWRVQFMGFAPGFGYLVPAQPADDIPVALAALCAVPRRSRSRHRVPAGSVAIAAGYAAIYPRESPGGWNLLGRSAIDLWDVDTDPPAMLAPGHTVRFRAT